MTITRFAPSPTGRLHLGHALSAVLNHDAARDVGGRFVLRIEDIDRDRCRSEYMDAILDDLRWLGLDWDACTLQTDHAADHAAALERLRAKGLLYACTCTRAEIAASAGAPHGDLGAVYPGTCRGRGVPATEPFAWRLDIARALAISGPLRWQENSDEAQPVSQTTAAAAIAGGDVVLARKGLGVAYHLAVVVDDAAAGVTDVIRGRDLFAATHVQRLLQSLLCLPTPRYRHHALIAGPDGRRLAKRTRGATLADLRVAGADPHALAALLRGGGLPVGFGWVTP